MGTCGNKKRSLGNWGKEEDEERNDTNVNRDLIHQTLKTLGSGIISVIRESGGEVKVTQVNREEKTAGIRLMKTLDSREI